MTSSSDPRESARHRCPKARPTPRAERLALIVSPSFQGHGWPQHRRDELAKDIAATRQLMKDKGLCESCGYPLDNSYPHPEAK